MAAPEFDLAALRDDLGASETEASDEWLERRVASIWARIEIYTQRRLGPVATFQDDWGRVVQHGHWDVVLPVYNPGRVSPYLRQTPVTEIVSAFSGAAELDKTKILFDPESGQIQSITGLPVHSLVHHLAGQRVRIVYKAGFAETPADLYEVVLGVLRGLYAIRAGGLAGAGALAFKSITVADVGAVQLGGAAGEFETNAMRTASHVDPLLGPWTQLLEPYVELRSMIGGELRALSTEVTGP